eukprot:1145237-Ditylum_brightwellii.AAC.1
MVDNNLKGEVPIELWQLPNLLILDLSSNDIDFVFEGVSKCETLKGLYLSDTGLSSLEGIGELKLIGLQAIDISSNEMTGTFPSELFTVPTLKDISMSHNSFSGSLEDKFDSFPDLMKFHAYGNDFTGQVPPSLGACDDLEDLVISENDFTGTLPPALNNLKNLEMLSIHQTTNTKGGITGPLISLKGCASLTTLHLGSNALSGSLPSDLLEDSNVLGESIDMDLSNNKFIGAIPSEWHRFDRLFIDLTRNEIDRLDPVFCEQVSAWQEGAVEDYGCDAILCPPQKYSDYGRKAGSDSECQSCENTGGAPFFGATKCDSSDKASEHEILKKLYYATNGPEWVVNLGWENGDAMCNWYGVECEDGKVVGIDLSENGLKGTVPPEIFTLSGLRELDLETND